MKRKKEKPEVKIDISDDLQPLTAGFKRMTLKALKAHRGNVDHIVMNGVLEHTPGRARIKVMRTVYKALKPGGKAVCTVPHWATAAASMSPFSQWPPLSPESFGFFSSEVRKRSNFTHPALEDIDFDLQWAEMYGPDWQNKADAVRSFAARHYTNALVGLNVTLTKKGK